jgi:hypothetical protein
MPERKSGHCMAVLKGGNVFVAGGVGENNKSCFLYEVDRNEWKRCPDMVRGRFKASCGVVRRRDGIEEIVVAGGHHDNYPDTLDAVEFFSFL